MKVVSWILFILSILAIPALVIIAATGITDDTITDMVVIGAIFFFILGFLSHVFISKSRGDFNVSAKIVYYASFPAFIIPFAVVFVVLMLLKAIDFLIYLLTDKHYILPAVNYVLKVTFGGGKNRASRNGYDGESSSGAIVTYAVIENGTERELTFLEQKQDIDADSPFYMNYYNRFIDDAGNYWRSYDDNENFVKETVEQRERGY